MKKSRIFAILFVIVSVVVLAFGVLSGCSARTAYELAKEDGYQGSLTEWLDSLRGKNAYQLALEHGMTNAGSEEEWIASLKVNDVTLEDLYGLYLIGNPDCSLEEFITLFLSEIPDSAEIAAQRALRCVVTVQARFSNVPTGESTGGGGSGVIISINPQTGVSYIVTNYHVIYKHSANPRVSADIQVAPYGKEYFPDPSAPGQMSLSVAAEFIGGSISKDIAVLRTVANSSSHIFRDGPYLAAQIADSNLISVGESVLTAGNPENEGISLTRGIISVDSELIPMEQLANSSRQEYHRVIRVDAAINHGNSGGGLFNKRGQLIGIVNAKAVDLSIDNIGYAIPSNIALGIARNIMEDVRENGTFIRYRIGVVSEIVGSKAELIPGGAVRIREELRVTEVTADLPAAASPAADRLAVGDVLLKARLYDSGGAPKAEEVELIRNFMLGDYLFNARRGDILELKVLRGAQERTCRVTIAATGVVPLDQL